MRARVYSSRVMIFIFLALCLPLNAQFAGGTGTADDPYLVETPVQLSSVRNYMNAHFRQIADIYLNVVPYNTGAGWVPIGSYSNRFRGTYDGDGFRIRHLYMYRSSNYSGLFGMLDYAVIRNIRISGANVTGSSITGIIAGMAFNSEISGCQVSGELHGDDDTGGIVGDIRYSTVSGCEAQLHFDAHEGVGGIAGYTLETNVLNCNSNLDYGHFMYMGGGIVGFLSDGSYLAGCAFSGTIYGASEVGGIAGYAKYSRIENCIADRALITGADKIGGIVGNAYQAMEIVNCASSATTYAHFVVGSFAGNISNNSYVNCCSATGDVNGGQSTGGFVGQVSYSTIINSYSTGTVTGSMTPGGFAGSIAFTGTLVQDCYSTGVVTSTGGSAGGFAGSSYQTQAVNCYWDMESSGCQVSATGEGRATDQMMYPGSGDTYVGWDFEHCWNWGSYQGYPVLAYQPVSNQDYVIPGAESIRLSAYPNPFNPDTTIRVSLAQAGAYRLVIYDIRGRKLRVLRDGFLSAGEHNIVFDGRDDDGRILSTGTYVLQVRHRGGVSIAKITLIK